MKTIYTTLLIGMVYLLSNTTYAQIIQYSDDGTKGCIDCEEKNGSIERNCLCSYLFQLRIFNYEISSLNIDYTKERWLYEQELLLAHVITGVNYFLMHTEGVGVPSDYNFENIQREYFKEAETDKLAEEYFTNIANLIKKVKKYDTKALYDATINSRILGIRKAQGTVNTKYGDLKYGDKFLKDMTDSEVNTLLNEQLNIRNNQRAAATEYGIRKSRLERMLKEGYISNSLAGYHIRHYKSLDYEDAIRFMTRYRIWVARKDNTIPYKPFGNPDNIFTLKEIEDDFTQILYNRTGGTTPPMDGYSPPTFIELSDSDALFNYAVNSNLGNNALAYLNKMPEVSKFLKAFMESRDFAPYEANVLRAAETFMKPYINGKEYKNSSFNFRALRQGGQQVYLQDRGNPNRAIYMPNMDYEIPLTNGFHNFANTLYTLFSRDDVNRDFEGAVYRDVFRDNDIAVNSGIPNEHFSYIFDIVYDRNLLPSSFPKIEIEFHNGLGLYFSQRGINLKDILENSFWADIAHRMVKGETFDFGFLEKVHNVLNNLNVDGEQTDWLLTHQTETELMDAYLKAQNYSANAISFVRMAYITYKDNGKVYFEDEIILDSSFLKTNAYCVYNELKKQNGNLFRSTIGSFIEDPKYNLYFRVGECADPADMCTDDSLLSSSSVLSIKIDNANLSPLENASNLLHEGIHAELYRFVNEANNGNVNPNERKRLFDLYKNFKGLNSMSSRAQHVYMAENYVTPIAKAIRKLDDNKYPLNYYMGFGWDGLRAYDYQGILSIEESKELYRLQSIVNETTSFNPNNCN